MAISFIIGSFRRSMLISFLPFGLSWNVSLNETEQDGKKFIHEIKHTMNTARLFPASSKTFE